MPHKAFLKKKSLLDRFKDDYATHTGYIQSARAEHTWNNPLTRRKRTKELNRWIKSFAGKDHIRKLARFNAVNAGKNEDYADGVKCLRYGSSFELPYGKIITALDKAIRCRRSGAFIVYITGWVENEESDPCNSKYTVYFDTGKYEDYFLTNNIQDLPNYQINGPIPSDNKVIKDYAMNENTNEAMSLKGFLENLTEKLTKQFNLDAEKVQAYLDSHTQEMQELLDDKDLSLKEKVLFVRSEITGEKDEAKKDNMTYVLCKIGPNDTTYCKNKYGAWTDHIEDAWEGSGPDSFTDAMKQNFADSIGAEIADLEIISFEKFESKQSESFVLPNPTIIYKGPIEDAKKACHYVSKILADKGLGWGRVSWQAPKDGEYHYRHPEKDVYTVTLRGSNDLIKDSFAVYKDVFGNDFWNNCDADPQGWVNPQTIARYDVATPRQESNETDEKLGYEKGHKNSRGEDAPWVIRSHEDNRVLASFANKKDAEEHLKRMKQYSKNESIENLPIHEWEFEKLANAYCDQLDGSAVPTAIEVIEITPLADEDGVLVKFDFDATPKGTFGTTYALIYGDLNKSRDNDLLYFLHDWQSGEVVTTDDIADHDWELANDVINPSNILNESKQSEDLETYACFIDFATENDAKKGMEIVKGWHPFRNDTAVLIDSLGEDAANRLWNDWKKKCAKAGLAISDAGEVYKEEPSCFYGNESKKSESKNLAGYTSDVLSELDVIWACGLNGAKRLTKKYADVIQQNYTDGDLSTTETAKFIAGQENLTESRKMPESKKSEDSDNSGESKAWCVTVEYKSGDGETEKIDVVTQRHDTEEQARQAGIAYVKDRYTPANDINVISAKRLPKWASRNIQNLVKNKNKSEDADDVTYELTEDAVTDLIKELGLEIVNTWYDGNKDRIVYDCKDMGDENGEIVCVWVEPPYEARVWLKDANPRVNQLVEGIETLDALKSTLVDIFKIELGESHVTESLRKPEDTIIVPNWLWETYTLGENYNGDTLTDDEQQTYLDFKEKYEGFSLKAVSEKTTFRSDNDFDSNGCPCYEVNVFKK